MPVLQNLYQVYKLPSSFIVENNLKIDNYTRKRAIQDGNLVSVGDNMVFYKIRDYYGDTRSHKEIFDAVQNLRTTLRICKRENTRRAHRKSTNSGYSFCERHNCCSLREEI